MKLHQLFEEIFDDKNFDAKKFKKDVKFFLSQTKGNFIPMLHGDRNAEYAKLELKTFKPRTRPKDSPDDLHAAVNTFLQTKFGYPFRNGLFITSDDEIADVYGPITVIIPIGEFEWLCNTEIHDVTAEHADMWLDTDEDKPVEERNKEATDLMISTMKKSKAWIHNKNLNKCLESGSEIMLKCTKYYQVDATCDLYMHTILPILKGTK